MDGRARGLWALGRALAWTGVLPKVAFGFAVVTVVGTAALAIGASRSPDPASLEAIPLVASNILAWGAGVLFAFGVATQALRRDRAEGVVHLCRARGRSATAYLWARVFGLATEVLRMTAGGTIVCGLLSALLGRGGHARVRALGMTAASVAFTVAFAVVIAPVALAALGTRKRLGGYLALVAVLGVPEALAPWTSKLLPTGWENLVSIPSAMLSLRGALEPGRLDLGLALRAVAVLSLVTALSLVAVRAELAGLGGPETEEGASRGRA